MNDLNYKTVAYADDVVILITGRQDNLNIISELMTSALKILSHWTKNNGLDLNPNKTELVLFTRRRKIGSFRPPKLNNIPLEIKNSVKYLGTILDRKLNFKQNIDERIKKTHNAFYACKQAIGKNWGFNPKIVHWIYTSVARPILTSSCFIWWSVLEIKCNKKKFDSVQRLASTFITKCLRSTPSSALEVILDLIPIDLYTNMVASNTAQRLNETNLWKYQNFGHSKILPSYGKRTDLITELNISRKYTTLLFHHEKSGRITHSQHQLLVYLLTDLRPNMELVQEYFRTP